MATSHILVLGAGELGLPVLESLATHPRKNLTRTSLSVTLQPNTVENPPPSKVDTISQLRALNITVIPFDIASATVQAFSAFLDEQKVDTIISCTGFSAGTGSQRKIAEASIASSSVKRFIPWQFGVDYDIIGRGSTQPLFDEQLSVRELLRSQRGTEWVVVSVGIFMTFLFENFWGVLDISGGVTRAFGSWDNELTTTAPEDIGRCVAEMVFVDWTEVKNSCVHLAGDTVTYAQVAESADAVLGKKLQRELWTEKSLKEDWAADKQDVLKSYRPIWAEGTGVVWPQRESYNAKKKISTVNVNDWIERLKG